MLCPSKNRRIYLDLTITTCNLPYHTENVNDPVREKKLVSNANLAPSLETGLRIYYISKDKIR